MSTMEHSTLPRALENLLRTDPSPVVVVAGAGLSAASGIPTFRGEEGYWTVDSEEYRPEELATREAFSQIPRDIWHWYLYRRTVCRGAQPNPSHHALVKLEQAKGDRFRLITQNVDGLHIRAGNSLERTYQIHGNIDYMRCLDQTCDPTALLPVPDAIGDKTRDSTLDDDDFALLSCSACGGPTRPHVLWFDEYYDEERYRAESSMRAAASAGLVITVGTSGATTLPHHVVSVAVERGAALVDINPDPNPFSRTAQSYSRGYWAQGTAIDLLPAVVERLCLA